MFISNVVKNSKAHVIEMANRASVQKLATESLSGLTGRLDNHESGLNTNAHGVSNIAGLQAILDSKVDDFTGYTGSITVVESVDFVAQTVVTATINISNGIITSIV